MERRPRVGIVGLGLIGGSVGLGLRQGFAEAVVGSDRSSEVADEALLRGCVDSVAPWPEGFEGCDLVVLAAPPSAIPALMEQAEALSPGTVVTDVASVKASVAKQIPERLAPSFVPGHPLAGTEGSGPGEAKADMFRGSTWVLCPDERQRPDALSLVERMVRALGASPVQMDPASHDRHVALVSHLPHVLAAALLMQSATLDHPEVAGGSWRDLTRVGGSSPELWSDIMLSNRDAMLAVLNSTRETMEDFTAALEAGDREGLRERFARASEVKRRGW